MPMEDNAYKFPKTKVKGFISKGFYIEMWWFAFHDEKAGVEFHTMPNINNPENNWFGRLVGLPKSCDLYTSVAFDGVSRTSGELDRYFPNYEVKEDSLYVNIGDVMFFEAIDDETIHVYGEDPWVKVSFDFYFTRAIKAIPATPMKISKRKRDIFWFYPNMPHARVKGTVTYEGETREVNCRGYHDHDWGSPTKLAWTPFTVTVNEEFGIVTYVSMEKHGCVFLFAEDDWIQLPMPEVEILEKRYCEFPGKGGEIVKYDRPVKIQISSHNDEYSVKFVISELDNKYFNFDTGFELKKKSAHGAAFITEVATATGRLYKKDALIKEFVDIPSSFQWYQPTDYIKEMFKILFQRKSKIMS
ncbi:MAG: hypothetical protein ACFFCS_04795 [Candidatus Hodarchaeota archaeon]